MYLLQPTLGMLCFVAALLGLVVVVIPRSWKVSIKMALRNLGRGRTRITTTMLALFVGLYAIGLILTLAQDLRNEINTQLNQEVFFNVQVETTGSETQAISAGLKTLPGLSASQKAIYVNTVPVSINGITIKNLLPTGSQALPSPTSIGNASALDHLSEVTGYDATDSSFLVTHNLHVNSGRSLNASDVGTDHVIIHSDLVQSGPLHLKLGDRITLASAGGGVKSTRTVTIVGTYAKSATNVFGDILAPAATALALVSTNQVTTVNYLMIDHQKLNAALATIKKIAPHAFVVNTADFSASINQLLDNLVLVLTTIASFSMLAGVIIMANTVALAMLERRRELGILKSVGYTSRTTLGEVLVEYGVVGALAALLATLLIIATMTVIGQVLFDGTALSVSGAYILDLILGSMLLAMLTAALVAWKSVHARPLDVLRYD
jgi:predicted lysophospholipase L1 biosynthesis ABC-type transport system permease subunit